MAHKGQGYFPFHPCPQDAGKGLDSTWGTLLLYECFHPSPNDLYTSFCIFPDPLLYYDLHRLQVIDLFIVIKETFIF